MLCFSHDWSGDPLSKTHLMRLLARHNRILWVNSIGYRAPSASRADLLRAFRKVAAATRPLSNPEPNLYVLNPLAVPAYGVPAARAFNARFLADVLTNVDAAQFALELNGPLSPGVFKPVGDDRYVHVVMPLRTTS